jgi:tripartite-type tricarboxylate transporter receptor subunit TctC
MTDGMKRRRINAAGHPSRKDGRLFACGLSLLLLISTATAAEQNYPARPVRFIVGFPAGGLADLMARSLAQKLTEAWAQQVIVDNRAGASGMLSMQIVASAPRDGYTLLLGSSTQFSINPGLRSVPYDPIRDYTPVIKAAQNPVVLTVHPSFTAKTLPELIQLAKAEPANIMSYGSSGYGAAPHIAAELLQKRAGISMTHVPYKGGNDAVMALLGGHIQMNFGAPSTALGHVKAGRLRALGVTGTQRLTAAPNVPTFAESGLHGFNVDQWYGVFMPAGVPQALVVKVNEQLVRALASPPFQEQFVSQGVELTSSTPAAFAAFVKEELVLWKRVLKELGIKDTP